MTYRPRYVKGIWSRKNQVSGMTTSSIRACSSCSEARMRSRYVHRLRTHCTAPCGDVRPWQYLWANRLWVQADDVPEQRHNSCLGHASTPPAVTAERHASASARALPREDGGSCRAHPWQCPLRYGASSVVMPVGAKVTSSAVSVSVTRSTIRPRIWESPFSSGECTSTIRALRRAGQGWLRRASTGQAPA